MAITKSRSGITLADAQKIVDLVRSFRDEGQHAKPPSIRESIKIARILKAKSLHPSKKDLFFKKVCLHVLTDQQHVADVKKLKQATQPGQLLDALIEKLC